MSEAASGTHEGSDGASGGHVLRVVAVTVAAVLHLVVGYFTVAAIGLISVPVWAIVLLAAAWLAAAAVLVRMARRRPLPAPLVPVVNGLLLWAVVTAGDIWLGWTA